MQKTFVSLLKIEFLRIVLLSGFMVAIPVTLFFTLWDWWENPSNIFHGPDGTNWRFVQETAISWFVPAFLYSVVVAIAIYVLLTKIMRISN